jgi:ribosome-associated toxin RatA of RatAB toxin-antitoxin module
MKKIERAALVQSSADRMYALVEDIESYPRFLPWCSRTEVYQRDEKVTAAAIHIAYHGIQQHFSTENLKEPGRAITMRLLQGPFKHLHGEWRFLPLGEDACKVEFCLSYELASTFLEALAGPVFHHIANTLLDAFVARAEALRAQGA